MMIRELCFHHKYSRGIVLFSLSLQLPRIWDTFYGFDKRLVRKKLSVGVKKTPNECHRCTIGFEIANVWLHTYTFRWGIVHFLSLLLFLLTNAVECLSFEFDFKANEAAPEPWQNTLNEWLKKNSFFLLENHSNWISPLLAQSTLQLQWNVYPICHLPAMLRGKPISDLNATVLLECMTIDTNDLYDIAGISENILLMQGNVFW